MFERLYFYEVTLQYCCKKVRSTTGTKKVKEIFETETNFLTCSKLIINELRCCHVTSDSV